MEMLETFPQRVKQGQGHTLEHGRPPLGAGGPVLLERGGHRPVLEKEMAGLPEKVAGRPLIPAAAQFLTRVFLNSVFPSLKALAPWFIQITSVLHQEWRRFLLKTSQLGSLL